MISSLQNRFLIVRSKLAGHELIRHSSWEDVLHECLKFYGKDKRAIRKRMRISWEGNLCRLEIDDRAIYWPAAADPVRLVDMYFEVYYEKNNHYFDIPETRVHAGDIVLDCGACEGYFTRKALESGAAQVHSIEPGQAVGACLRKTFGAEIRSGRVFVHPCLLGASNETVGFHESPQDPTICQIHRSGDNRTSGEELREVEMMTLDQLCARNGISRVDFIKADVEGGEIGLLLGAEKTLRAHKPRLAIAAYHNPEDANRMVEFIESLNVGYRFKVKGIVVFDGVPRPVMVHCY